MGQRPEISMKLSFYESIVFMAFAAILLSVVLISAWSSILLAIGRTHGGGPLGMIAGFLVRFIN